MTEKLGLGWPHSRQNLSKKGAKTHATILESAAELLAEAGLEGFSVNRVAEKAGVSLGNLQYYFPSRKHLLYSLLENQIIPGQERLHAIAESATGQKQVLLDLLHYGLELNMNDAACAVAWSTVSAALYDDDIKSLADTWFTSYHELITKALRLYEPSLSNAQLRSLSLQIMSLVEGNALIWRHTVPGPRQCAAAQKALIADIELLIKLRSES